MYNTYLVGVDSFEAKKQLGTNLDAQKAKEVEEIGMRGVDYLEYFTQSVEVGSERDLQLLRDIKRQTK